MDESLVYIRYEDSGGKILVRGCLVSVEFRLM